MTDPEREARLTMSQMIHRTARGLKHKTLEEKLEIIKASERNGDEIKARFEAHFARYHRDDKKS